MPTIKCTECGEPAIGYVGDPNSRPTVRAMVVCPECLEKVPDEIANLFIEALNKINGKKG